MKISLDKSVNTPLYVQLCEEIKENIIKENLKEEEKLPSIRSLARELNINNITVINAYKLLEKEGYVYSKGGSGTYVRSIGKNLEYKYYSEKEIDLMSSGILTLSKNSINFANISPNPELFPVKEFKEAIIEVLDREKGNAFVYPEINGYEPLRESISSFLKENYKIDVEKNQIQITSGGQQGIDIVTKTLIYPGDYVFVENPTYQSAIDNFKWRGANILDIPINENGIDIDTLKKRAKEYRPKLLYVMPNYQSPTTYSYSEKIKEELVKCAYEYNFYILEDDFLSDLTYQGEKRIPLKAIDKHDQIIYIKTFSKIFMPGIRMGFLTIPKRLSKGIIRAKHITDISSSGFIQKSFDLYLRKGLWKNHMENIMKIYKKKYKLMLKEITNLKKYGVSFFDPKGGLSFWLKLPAGVNSIDMYNECAKNNVIIVPGDIFFIDKNIDTNYIRLSFGDVDDEYIIKGMRTIENFLIQQIKEKNQYIPLV
ncbi:MULTISPECIES: MocR-like pyridoxine biosynthesis transcription factor PdxR [Tissierellales]|jgi:DNA-binding transcriptional MocR family regulator|uniref:MocR-like pyridoxine biosynthesis transcription factor PdxR n=1 Tax=Tissierellales TaxID=1737405 RepID=UPI00089FC672|nr:MULTISPECIES: PLP-dependent aminotransferase family protein [Tissierellales]SCL92316.1 2-aminoadipate transaminase [Sporanaerobacter sp. PP17-6a]